MGNIITMFVECIASALDAMYHKRQNELYCGKKDSKEEMKNDIKEIKQSIIKGDEMMDKISKEFESFSPKKKGKSVDKDKID